MAKATKFSAHSDGDGGDIYDKLGFGFTAYFRMLWNYMCLFLLFTVLLLPTYYIYGSHGGMPAAEKVQAYSLGNMGFSGSFCINQNVGYWNATEGANSPEFIDF